MTKKSSQKTSKAVLKNSAKNHDQALKAMNKIVDSELRKIAKSSLYKNVETEIKAEIAAKNAKAQLQKMFKKLPANLAKLLKESVGIKLDGISLSSRLTTAAQVGEAEGGPVGAIARVTSQLDLDEKVKKKTVRKKSKSSSRKKTKKKK